MKTRDAAKGRWKAILPMLGIDAAVLDGKHHPCPANGQGEDRFRFADREGTGSYFCHCSTGKGNGIDLVKCCRGVEYAEAAKLVDSVVGRAEQEPEKPKRDPRPALQRIQSRLKPASGPVRRYLAGRGLTMPPSLRQARLTYWDGREQRGVFECMVAKVVAADGSPVSFHVTYLHAGAKADVPAPRKVMPPIGTINGAAVRLYPKAAHIGIAEGIETAIAAHLLSGLPVWSVLNANGVQTFDPPEGVEHVTVFADNDANGTGQAAAYACMARLVSRGITCDVRLPETGKDWNDVLQRQEAAA